MAIGIVVATAGHDRDTVEKGYSADGVADACDLLDLSVLNRWESRPGKRDHKKERNVLGTVLTCEAENESANVARLAAMTLTATIHDSEAEALAGYEMGERFAENSSGATPSGTVPGLGDRSFLVWNKKDYSPTSLLNQASSLQLSTRDGQLEIHLIISIAADFDEDEVVTVATEQVRRVMNTLKG
ncbi:hypothetical protein ACFQZZ_02215 [Nocardia sp. GCM10030253]|uniref:hypothetical protein n=1 Tax=Nocardia sp. GCM10030253 TaxID=3273404 RepID=UPI00363F4AF4